MMKATTVCLIDNIIIVRGNIVHIRIIVLKSHESHGFREIQRAWSVILEDRLVLLNLISSRYTLNNPHVLFVSESTKATNNIM